MSGTAPAIQLPLAAPLIDLQTGKITEVWRRAFQSLIVRTGGGSGEGPSVGTIAIDLSDDMASTGTVIDFGDDPSERQGIDLLTMDDDAARPVLLLLASILSEPDVLIPVRPLPPDLLVEDSTQPRIDPLVGAMLVSEE